MGLFQDEDCCFDCTRISLIILNTIFCIVGVSSIAVGISMVFKGEWFMSFVHIDGIDYIEPSVSLRNLTIAGYVLCAFGGVLFIFMLLGLFGSSYSNQCLLGSYVTCLVVILLVKIGLSIFIFLEWKKYESSVEGNLRRWMIDEHELNVKKVREIQTNHSCCGVSGPEDYDPIPQRKDTCPRKLAGGDAAGGEGVGGGAGGGNNGSSVSVNQFIEIGCREAIIEGLELKLIIAGGIGLGIVVIELIGIILANILVCSLRSDIYYYD